MLEPHGVVTAVVPSCGWSYLQPMPQGEPQRIPPKDCAGDDVTLVKMVKEFRAINRIPLDNAEADIAEYIKKESPQNDRFPGRLRNPAQPARVVRPHRPLIERITDWLMDTLARQPVLLIDDDAIRRAMICVQCPQNVRWQTGCLPCCDNVTQRGNHLRQRASYAPADNLGGCRLHNFLLPAAVFVDRDDLGGPSPEAPPQCWMITEPRRQENQTQSI